MAADIIWYFTIFGCAALFVGIGFYAKGLKSPMWFWSGSTVEPNSITDVRKYNAENARMWIVYSLWFWVSGFVWFWSRKVAVITMVLGCTLGMVQLIVTYRKIEKKYKKTGL